MKLNNRSKLIATLFLTATCLSFTVNKVVASPTFKAIAQTPDEMPEKPGTPETPSENPEVQQNSVPSTPETNTINTSSQIPNVKIVGLGSNNTIINIGRGRSRTIKVKGVDGNLQGIDFRPANGMLYGVTDTDNIYIIDPNNGQAQLVSKLSSSFNGGFQAGFDFNPVPDRLRIVGSNDQNFRTNVDVGMVNVDTAVQYAQGDPNFGVDPNITAVGYTNNRAGAQSTQLFGIDYDLDVLVLQDPPNNGTLKTVGKLGVNFAPIGGLDIFTDSKGNNTAFAASGSTLYNINLSNGSVKKLADVPGFHFIGLAVSDR